MTTPPAPAIRNRRGATLPMVVLVIAILSIGLAVGFLRTGAELRAYSSQQAQTDAMIMAENAIAQLLGGMAVIPASGTLDTTITGLRGGTTDLSLRRLRDSAGSVNDTYVLIARAHSSGSSRYDASIPTAEHTMARLLTVPRATTTMHVVAAVMSLNGVTHTGSPGVFDGNDAQKAGVMAYPDPVAGLALPTGTYSAGGSPSNIKGSPNGPPLYLGTPSQAANAAGIDWQGIVNGTAVTPDYTLANCSSLPSTPSYPIVYVTGDCVISGAVAFAGTLVVMGNLTMSSGGGGDPQLRGIVLVGKTMTLNGSPQGWGTVITGLNRTSEEMPQPAGVDVINGSGQFWFSSSQVDAALQRLQLGANMPPLVLVPNSLVDNYPSY